MDPTQFLKDLVAFQDPDFMYVRRYLEARKFVLRDEGARARAWCLERAREGDTEAQYVAAALLSAGLFGPMEKLDAMKLCEASAGQGFAPALLLLANFYESGWADVEVDEHKARELTRRAAEQGYAPAMNALAMMFLADAKPGDSSDAALRYLREASEVDYAPAQVELANRLFESGDPAHRREGMAMLTRAAELGYPRAHRTLGFFYKSGQHGLAKDEENANRHLSISNDLEKKGLEGLV